MQPFMSPGYMISSEVIKQGVILSLNNIKQIYADLLYYKGINKFSQPKLENFRAEIISLYDITLRSKMVRYINDMDMKYQKENNDEIKEMIKGAMAEYINLIESMDRFSVQPSHFMVGDMINAIKMIAQFCDDYGLTTISTMQQQSV